MLLIAELFVHKRIPLAVKRFIKQRIVTAEDLPRFHAAIESATRLRNSMPLELALCLLVWTAGIWFWRNEIAQVAPTWYGFSDSTGFHLRPAGYWNVLVSIPIVQLLLLRWYLKLFVWFSFLWHVSRLNLNLWPSHPDRSGGLGFLGTSVYSFSLVLVAQGAIMCGTIANGVLDEGQTLMSYRLLILTAVAFFVVVILGPLTMFTPHLTRAKRNGLAMYGNLATDYVMQFEHKWLGHGTTPGEVLGTGDIQSLADLGNSYAVVREMRFVPFGVQDITRLVVTTAAPLLPLLLIVMPLEEMVMRVLKSIF